VAEYLLIESRDPFDSADTASFAALAGDLAKAGHTVTLFLVQNGVLPARLGVKPELLATLLANGAEVSADEFSLRERGISADRLIAGVRAAPLDLVIDQQANGRRALWH
jgi:hypothetical protein